MIDYRARTIEVNDGTYAAWNAHDPDAVAAVFAEDAVLREVGSPQETRSDTDRTDPGRAMGMLQRGRG